MKNILWIAAVVSLAFLQAGCKSAEDKAADKVMDAMEDQVDILKGIDDVESAKAALPKLEENEKKAKAAMEELEKLTKDMEKEAKDELEEKYEPRAEELGKAMRDQIKRLMEKPEIWNVLKDKLGMGMDIDMPEMPDMPDMPDAPEMPSLPGSND